MKSLSKRNQPISGDDAALSQNRHITNNQPFLLHFPGKLYQAFRRHPAELAAIPNPCQTPSVPPEQSQAKDGGATNRFGPFIFGQLKICPHCEMRRFGAT